MAVNSYDAAKNLGLGKEYSVGIMARRPTMPRGPSGPALRMPSFKTPDLSVKLPSANLKSPTFTQNFDPKVKTMYADDYDAFMANKASTPTVEGDPLGDFNPITGRYANGLIPRGGKPYKQGTPTVMGYPDEPPVTGGTTGGGTMMSGTNLAKLDASLGTLRNQLVPGVGGSSAGSSGQQQGSSAQSSQGGGGTGVSGIQFGYRPGVDPRTGAASPIGYQGTLDPLYDPKYAFWNKGIPSKFYDPVDPNFDPSKPRAGFGDQMERESKARARWIGAMTDAEYSFYRRSLGQGAGSSGQAADAMRQMAKNPPAPVEQYGDPNKGQPGPIGLRGEAANSKAAPTNYMGGSKTFNESTGTRMENIKLGSGTGLGKPSLVKLPGKSKGK